MVTLALRGTSPDSNVLKEEGYRLTTRDDGSIPVTLSGANAAGNSKSSSQIGSVTPRDYRLFCSSYSSTVNFVHKLFIVPDRRCK